jgi:serine/threonine protein kinase
LNSGDQLSHYEIVKLIAEGGMGYVYKAHEPALDRMVAIKLLKPEFVDNQEVVECFEREARAIAELRHQNIISIHYIQRAERFYFFVMDYIDGCTVEDWVKAGRCFTLAEAKYFMTQAISALDAAAKAQLIHLDIKPSNFLVDAQGTIVLTDFGLAQKIGQIVSAEEKEYVFGTPYYVAPEQASGEPTDMRSDIYSLGATLYHLMVGAPPFEGKTTQVLKSHTAEPFPFNKALLSGVPKDWLEFIRKMMEADPKDRWQNYDVLSRALSQLPPKTLPATMSGLGRPAYSKTPQRPANIAETYVYDTAPLR